MWGSEGGRGLCKKRELEYSGHKWWSHGLHQRSQEWLCTGRQAAPLCAESPHPTTVCQCMQWMQVLQLRNIPCWTNGPLILLKMSQVYYMAVWNAVCALWTLCARRITNFGDFYRKYTNVQRIYFYQIYHIFFTRQLSRFLTRQLSNPFNTPIITSF